MKKKKDQSPMDRILEAIFGKNGERYEEVMRKWEKEKLSDCSERKEME